MVERAGSEKKSTIQKNSSRILTGKNLQHDDKKMAPHWKKNEFMAPTAIPSHYDLCAFNSQIRTIFFFECWIIYAKRHIGDWIWLQMRGLLRKILSDVGGKISRIFLDFNLERQLENSWSVFQVKNFCGVFVNDAFLRR